MSLVASKEDKGISKTVGIQEIRDDPHKIEGMTIQQLREALRSFGVPAKGRRKSDLVFALKCFIDNNADGESSPALEQVSSSMTSISRENISPKSKVKRASTGNDVEIINSTPEVSGFQQLERRVKRPLVIGETNEARTDIHTTEENLSIKTTVASDKRHSLSKRKVYTAGANEIAKAAENVNRSGDFSEPWTNLVHKRPQQGWVAYNPRIMRPPPLTTDTPCVKLVSWNVNGLRALLKLEGLSAAQLAKREDFDVLCLQETKLQEKDVESIKHCLVNGYENSFWTCSVAKRGYSGTAIVSRIKPLSVRYGLGISDHDSEGRLVTAEFDKFYLINAYVPNSGDGLKRLTYRTTQWDVSLSSHIKELEKTKPVILTGDLNCAHQEIDIHDPAGNKRSAGFTDEERQSFEKNFLCRGLVDTFRKQHPGVVGYTYWGYRHNGRKTNKGWRLDYFLVSESIVDDVHDSYILPDVMGSDHSPIGLILKV